MNDLRTSGPADLRTGGKTANDNVPRSAREKLVEAIDARVPLTLQKFSYLYVSLLLERHHGKKLHAAKALGIDRRTIQRWVKARLVTVTTAQRELFVDERMTVEGTV